MKISQGEEIGREKRSGTIFSLDFFDFCRYAF